MDAVLFGCSLGTLLSTSLVMVGLGAMVVVIGFAVKPVIVSPLVRPWVDISSVRPAVSTETTGGESVGTSSELLAGGW